MTGPRKTQTMNKTKPLFALLALTLPLAQAIAHGEDKLGPNKGYVRMPGGFHTEVVKVTNQKFKLYLLDLEWKNPTIVNSTAETTFIAAKEEKPVSCVSKVNFFECDLPKGTSMKTGTLSIKATRDGAGGGLALYELPLRLIKQKKDEHEGHH